METSISGVFAAGDAVTGPATVIQAIAGGKKVADAIDRQLSGVGQPVIPPVPVRRARIEWLEVSAARKMELERPQMPMLKMDKRCTTYQQVELGYPEALARAEASRCLRCDVCIRCGKCVEICRDMMGINALEMGYVGPDGTDVTDFRITKERCILCGACAVNCPSEAIKVIERNDERILSLCGTILNRQKLIYCDICGEPVGTDTYLDHLKNRLSTISKVKFESNICGVCARKEWATCINQGGVRTPVLY
jgi:ferredoxin